MKKNLRNKIFLILICIIIIVLLYIFYNNNFSKYEKFTNNEKMILINEQSYTETCGGCITLYYLAYLLKQQNINVKMYGQPNNNNIFTEFTDTFDAENTIVVYSEGINGNPLNAKYSVRWLLSELGKNMPADIYLSWPKTDLCYYFLSEKKIKDSPEKNGSIYKFLTTIYLKPNTFINHHKPRSGYCHIFKKSNYHKNLQPFHPDDSVELHFSNYEELVEFFNKYEYFICYDPASFLIFLAALCGCIPILHKVEGVSKEQYFTGKGDSNSCFFVYYQTHPYTDYPGIAYGMEDLKNAKNTIDLFPDLFMKQIEYTNNTCVDSFIEDMKHFDENINTIENNYVYPS